MSNIKSIRARIGITQSSLANDVDLTQGAIAHYENGRRNPGLDECRRIVVALNSYGAAVTLDEVFPPVASPTLNTNLRQIPSTDQSHDHAGVLYSAKQATA